MFYFSLRCCLSGIRLCGEPYLYNGIGIENISYRLRVRPFICRQVVQRVPVLERNKVGIRPYISLYCEATGSNTAFLRKGSTQASWRTTFLRNWKSRRSVRSALSLLLLIDAVVAGRSSIAALRKFTPPCVMTNFVVFSNAHPLLSVFSPMRH